MAVAVTLYVLVYIAGQPNLNVCVGRNIGIKLDCFCINIFNLKNIFLFFKQSAHKMKLNLFRLASALILLSGFSSIQNKPAARLQVQILPAKISFSILGDIDMHK